MEMFSISFKYRASRYYAIMRVKRTQSCVQYHATIMNGDLEMLLYTNHIFCYESGKRQSDNGQLPSNIGALRQAIAAALDDYLDAAQFSTAKADYAEVG
jgi:hypothetical protein